MHIAFSIDSYFERRPAGVSRFLLTVAIFLLLATGMGVPPATAQQPSMRFESINQVSGTIGRVVGNGQYVYVAEGPRLVVLDVSDPRTPRAVGQSPELSGLIARMAVSGQYVYLVIQNSSSEMTVHVINVNVPTSPKLLGSLSGIPGYAGGFAAGGNRVYIAAGEGGLRIIDVSVPGRPVEVSSLGGPGPYVYRVTVGEDARYVYTFEGEFSAYNVRIIDVSNPAAPIRLGALQTGERFPSGEFAFSGHHLFFLSSGYFRAIDVSNPANPIVIGGFTVNGDGYEVRVVGTRAYVLIKLPYKPADPIFYVLDVTDPTRPTLLGTRKRPRESIDQRAIDFAGDFTVVGTKAYFAFASGLGIVEFADPALPIELGDYAALHYGKHIAITDRRAYVVSGFGFRIFDLSNPLQPEMVGSYPLPSSEWDARVTVAAGRAFITSNSSDISRVYIFDVVDPTRPTLIGNYQLGSTPEFYTQNVGGVVVVGNDMYLATTTGLRIIDISTPATPREVSTVRLRVICNSSHCRPGGLAIVGDRAYMGLGTLHAFDISDRANPRWLGQGDTTIIDIRDIVVRGRYVFAAASPGLRIFDVADPTRPIELKFAKIGEVRSPVLKDNQLYVTVNQQPHIFDVSDPANPIQLTSEPTRELSYGVNGLALACGYVYTISDYSGLRVLQAVPTVGTSFPTPATGVYRRFIPLLVQRTTSGGC